MQKTFIKVLADTEDFQKQEALMQLADTWAQKDSEAAISFVHQLEVPGSRNPFTFAALSGWATKDPSAATAWVKRDHTASAVNFVAAEEMDYFMVGVIRGTARNNTKQATKQLISLPPGEHRNRAVNIVLQQVYKKGRTAVIKWIDKLPGEDPTIRIAALRYAIQLDTLESTPTETLKWIEHWDAADQHIALPVLVEEWSRTDPDAAATWAKTLTDQKLQSEILGVLIEPFEKN